MKNIACIVMASGHSTRFGSNKLLAEHQGKPLVQHIIEKLQKLAIDIIVVTRYEEIQALCKALNVHCLLHSLPYQNDTIRLGLESLSTDYKGYMFSTGDQPLVQEQTLARLIADFLAKPNFIHRLNYKDRPGNPVIFPAAYYNELCQLPEDKGGSYIIKRNLDNLRFTEVCNEKEIYDVDTVEDLTRL